MAEGEPAADIHQAGAGVDPDFIEIAAFFGEGREGAGGQEGDVGVFVVFADGGHGAEGLDEIAEGAEFYDEDFLLLFRGFHLPKGS